MTPPRVSADTITALTAPDSTSPPSAAELTGQIRVLLARRAAETGAAVAADQGADERLSARFNRNAGRAADDVKKFEKILRDVPRGFRLAPVWHEPLADKKKAPVLNEFSGSVLWRFMRFLSENHAESLSALGICDRGIEDMRAGLEPFDAQGRPYNITVDHIIERSGSESFAHARSPDPDWPASPNPRHGVNHFRNLILLPAQVHEYKNMLMLLQLGRARNTGQWVLTLAPERNAEFSGFVCPPQEPSHPLRGLKMGRHKPVRCIGRARHFLKEALDGIKVLKRSRPLRRTLAKIRKTAAGSGETAAEKHLVLGEVFNRAAASDPSAHRHAEHVVRPALVNIAKQTAHAFADAAPIRPRRAEEPVFARFLHLYHGKKMRLLRKTAAQLPFPEADGLRREFRKIDQGIENIRKAQAEMRARSRQAEAKRRLRRA